MIVLCDIDNTINNLCEILLNELNERNCTCYQYSEITDYDWLNRTFDNPFELTNNKEFWDKVSVNLEAVRILESIVNEGYEVYFVTASYFNDTLGYKINRTLSFFNPKIFSYKNIIIAQDKHMIKGDILIDDYINNLETFEGEKICFAQPWNESWKGNRLLKWPKKILLTNNSE